MAIEVRKPTVEEVKETENWGEWGKEASEFDWSYDEKETCLILAGRATVEDKKTGEKAEFGTGDWVVFPAGLEAVWRITEPIKKKYNFG